MSTLNQLKQCESQMVAAIRATTQEINNVGKMPLQVALAELQEATAEAKHRIAEAMAILKAAIGDIVEFADESIAELQADIASLGIPETSIPDVSPEGSRQEEETSADDSEYLNPHSNRIHPQIMSTVNYPVEVVERFGEDGIGLSSPDVTHATATLPEPSVNGTSHGKKKKRK